MLIWELLSGQKELRLLKGFRLLTESVPRSLRVGKAKGGGEVGGRWRMWEDVGGDSGRGWERVCVGEDDGRWVERVGGCGGK